MRKKSQTTTLKLIKNQTIPIEEVNTSYITGLMRTLSSTKGIASSDNERIKHLRSLLDEIIDDFQTSYKEMVSNEIKLMNLNVAADSIVKRNKMVDDIYSTTLKELNIQQNQ